MSMANPFRRIFRSFEWTTICGTVRPKECFMNLLILAHFALWIIENTAISGRFK